MPVALRFARRVGPMLAAAATWLIATSPALAYRPRVLRIGFMPSEKTEDVLRNAQPIVAQMHQLLGMEVVPFVANDYAGVIEAMKAKRLDVAFFAPGAYLLAERQAHARAILKVMRNGKSTFYTAIITRSDSPIRALRDLKGKTFAFGDPASLSGSLYPRVMLMNDGIDPDRDLSRVTAPGGHDATVLAVLNHKVDAGATFANDNQGHRDAWHQFLKDPKQQAQIRVVAYSMALPSDNVAVADGLDADLVARIKAGFLRMSNTPQGLKELRRIYRIDGFTTATPEDYAMLRDVFERAGYKKN